MAPPSSRRNPWCLVSDRYDSSRGSSSGSASSAGHGDQPPASSAAASSSSGSSGSSSSSRQRAAALEIVAAFNRNNIDAQTIAAFGGPGFVREVLPASLAQPPQDARAFQRALNMYRAVFRHYRLDVLEVVDDVPARKVCLWLTARADTVAGKYVCDMVWALTFDETGTRVVVWREFLDAGARTGDFLPETMDGGRPAS